MLVRKTPNNEQPVTRKDKELRIVLQNNFPSLTEEAKLKTKKAGDNLTRIIAECAVDVGGRIAGRYAGKRSRRRKILLANRKLRQSEPQLTE